MFSEGIRSITVRNVSNILNLSGVDSITNLININKNNNLFVTRHQKYCHFLIYRIIPFRS